jgi:penicillin-binding protein 1A
LDTNKIATRIKWIWKSFLFIFIFFFLFILGIRYNVFGLFGSMPDETELENPKTDLPVEIISEEGMIMGRYFREMRIPVDYDHISPYVIDALVSTEDIRFYEHAGIDAISMAAIFWYMAKGDQRGGSTITQQLAKNLYKTRRGTDGVFTEIPLLKQLIYKVKEWITAVKLERNFTKQEILNLYLNTVDFGSNSYGINIASRRFYNTSPDSLTLDQAATLIGALKATTTYNPYVNPEKSIIRRNTVLMLMHEAGKITQEQKEQFVALPIEVDFQRKLMEVEEIAPYCKAEIMRFAEEWCKKQNKDMYSEGLKIFTTLNYSIQKHAEDAVNAHMKSLHKKFLDHWAGKNPWVYGNKKEIPGFLDGAIENTPYYSYLKNTFSNNDDSIKFYLNKPRKMRVFTWEGEKDTIFSMMDSLAYYKRFLHAGFMAVAPKTGEVKAWVGGINHKYFQYDHVKRSQHQPGSAFKPFVYATAIKQGYTPCDRLVDEALTVVYEEDGKRKTWSPKNADWVYSGHEMSLRRAMARSVNTIAASLIQKVGYTEVINTARSLGIKSNLAAFPSLALGPSDVSVYEMTGAYATFVNEGIYIEPYFISRIEDRKGNVLYEAEPLVQHALTPEEAYTMVHMLVGGTEIGGGTSQGLFSYDIFRGNQIGGKTGTTSNYSDGWFMGVTRDIVAGMWVGGEDRCIHFSTSATGEGSKTALPIFGRFLEKVYDDKTSDIKPGYFPKPKNYSVELYCPEPVYVDTMAVDSTFIDFEGDSLFFEELY